MPIVITDPLTWTMVALGWVFAGSTCILLLALVMMLVLHVLGIRRRSKLRALLVSIALYLLGVTIINVVTFSGTTPYWPSVVVSYAPAISAPITALLGFNVWPRKVH